MILIVYRLNFQFEFLMIKQKQSSLLSGLWSFIEINTCNNLNQMNERKRKIFLIEELQHMMIINKILNIENIKLAGHVCTPLDKSLGLFIFLE